MNGCPAVEQHAREERNGDEGVDGSEETVSYETAHEATGYS
jgi:hypothetical protein